MSPEEELRSLLRKIEAAPFNPPGPEREMFARKISDYHPVQQQQLEQLWREEEAARRNLRQHFYSRINDANLLREEPASDVSQYQATLQHPELTDFCYKQLLANHLFLLWRNVDRLAYNNNLVSNVPGNLPQVQVPAYAREILEGFVVKFGLPDQAEVLLLSRALGISEGTVSAFYTGYRKGYLRGMELATQMRRKKRDLLGESLQRR